MIISWFTQPPENKTQPPGTNFSSYYQYDTVTSRFSRIRLELGRVSNSEGTTDTFVSYRPKRAIGFSDKNYSPETAEWSADDVGKLYYKRNPLPRSPRPGWRVYDTSDSSIFVHRGNLVTEKPLLPEGIEKEHLALLANDAMQNARDFTLTPSDASKEELAAALKRTMCSVMGEEDFASITDEMIRDKLVDQAKSICLKVIRESVSGVGKALETANDENILINEQIQVGQLTPTQAFTEAFASLNSALTKAWTASGNAGNADVAQALIAISEAQDAVEKALTEIVAAKNEAVAALLDRAANSLAEAEQHASTWQAGEMEYEPLTEARSVEDYMEAMSGAEEV